jgi:predicted tellurium resistance membrane protein TerC
MPLFAAATAKTIPPNFWIGIGIAILALIVAVIALRKLAKANKVVVTIVALVVMSVVGFSWIYERNEPSWATPAVQWLANYFPTKGAVKAGPGSGVR